MSSGKKVGSFFGRLFLSGLLSVALCVAIAIGSIAALPAFMLVIAGAEQGPPPIQLVEAGTMEITDCQKAGDNSYILCLKTKTGTITATCSKEHRRGKEVMVFKVLLHGKEPNPLIYVVKP